MRRTLTALLAALATLVPAGAALADKPFREPLPTPGPVTLTGYCDFPLLVEVLVNRERVTLREDRIQINGRLVIRLTNTETGESLVVNVSGPARIGRRGDFAMGRTFIALSAAETGGDPVVVVTSGRVRFTTNDDGTTTMTTTGRSIDICARLG